MDFTVYTKGHNWRINGSTHDDIQIALLTEIRDEARDQTMLMLRQVAILERTDERLKRGGFSLAKRNRK